jgi:hypothetical protein
MVRTTRSGQEFSPYVLETLDLPHYTLGDGYQRNVDFDVVFGDRARVDDEVLVDEELGVQIS